MKETVVVFGAGASGRGHVGLLAWQAGYRLVFVDARRDLVDALQGADQYTVRLFGPQPQEVAVTGYRAHHHLEREAVAGQVRDAALVLTAAFDQNLPDVARTIALGIGACRAAGRTRPLNCIACENMMDSSSTLGRHVRALLAGRDLAWCERYVGFPDCMISRVVPQPAGDPLELVAEDYNEWTVRADAFRGPPPAGLAALELVDNQSARLERKLFIHNGGHAICGYLGFHRRHRYVHEAVADPGVAEPVVGALAELGEVVRRRHGFSRDSVEAYARDLCVRGAVPEMRDEILRVVRQPLRKLSARERLVAPALLAVEYGLPRRWIVTGIVAALKYRHAGDPQSLELAARLEGDGLIRVLEEVCAIGRDSSLAAEIQEAWNRWSI